MADSVQITIPTFEDDDDLPGIDTIPFGRGNGFGSSGFGFGSSGGSGSGFGTPTGGHGFGGSFGGFVDDSPITTPIGGSDKGDRSYFHTRGDSVTSEGSVQSGGHSFKSGPGSVKSGSVKSYIPTAPSLVHSSSSSVTTTSIPSLASRKSSFASIRNAFKGKGAEAPPPLPSMDQPYPYGMKNPAMPRSNSSLAHATMTSGPSPRRPSVTTNGSSPQGQRPPTPQRPTTPSVGTSRHVPKRSASLSRHTQTSNGSYFHFSEPGNDLYNPMQASPPPVPRMPEEYVYSNGNSREHLRTPSLVSIDESKPVIKEPRTPAEYALHTVFASFVISADHKVSQYLRYRLNQDPPFLPEFIGPGVDPSFDALLDSLAKIAQKQLKRVVESVLRWRNDQNKTMDESILRSHMNNSPSSVRSVRTQDAPSALRQRKGLVSIYIACRALIVVFSSITKDQLGAGLGNSLEEIIFEQFRRHDLKVVSQSVNHRANVEIAAQLLGHLSNIRFETVTDRFLAELKPITVGQVGKEGDPRFENLVQSLRYVQIKVWPPEAFDEGAEFVLALSRAFERAHGTRLKTTFAETLTRLLHSVGKTAQHEVNHPDWAKAIETILPKAQDMMSKARYWQAAYPLVVTCLCVAPHDLFLKHWLGFFEGGLSKIKEKSSRIYVLNGMMRLLWTYLYRCQESASTAQTRLDGILKHFFPPNRLSVFPGDDAGVVLLHMMHFVISRHFEYGCDFALGLMQESTLMTGKQKVINTDALAPERTVIGFRAILLSLTCMEKEKRTPAWPSSSDFSCFDNSGIDWPLSGDRLPDTVLSKNGVQVFIDRLRPLTATVGRILSQTVGNMSVFDDRWGFRPQILVEDVEPHLVRLHPEGKVAYPRSVLPQIDLLITLFDSWPRCLSEKLPLMETLDLLFHGLIHVEPDVGDAASRSVLRFAADPNRVTEVMDRFNRFLFGPYNVLNQGSGIRLFVERPSLLQLWSKVVDIWIKRISSPPEGEYPGPNPWMIGAATAFYNLQGGALFLLTHIKQDVRMTGVKTLRKLHGLCSHLQQNQQETEPGPTKPPSPPDLIDILNGRSVERSMLEDHAHLLNASDRKQLAIWREEQFPEALRRLAESDKDVDRRLWRFVFPSFIRLCMEQHHRAVTVWRETVNATVLRYHPLMSSLAGITGRTAVGQQTSRAPGYNVTQERERTLVEYSPAIEQWHFWIRGLCAAALASDSRPPQSVSREHARAPSDLTTQRERLSTARGLFRHLTAFLASEHKAFRDAVVSAFGSIHQSTFSILLEDLQPMTRHILDGRSKMVQRGQGQEHLYASVAHIYQLTAHFVHDPRNLGEHGRLHLLLAFVRETRNFLIRPDNRHDPDLNPLRRYFCGVVEHLFDRLNSLQDSHRFISKNMRLRLYRLCEEWCNLTRPVEGKAMRDIPEARSRAEEELSSVVGASYGAMAALCQGAFFAADGNNSSESPSDVGPPEHTEPLSVDSLLERIIDMMASSSASVNASGRRALMSLLRHPYDHEVLTDAAVRWSFVTSANGAHFSKSRFFDVVVDVIRTYSSHHFSFGQVVFLGLCNLSCPAVEVRKTAFNLLAELHRQHDGQLSLAQFEAAIGSMAPSVYLHAQRQLSDLLAAEHTSQGAAILAQCAMRLPQVYDNMGHSMHERILQFLEPWMSTIELMPEGYSQLSPEGYRSLCNLFSLTVSYVDRYPDHIQALWGRLVDQQYPMNSSATIKFLIEQAIRRASTKFITYAGRVISCLSRTPVGKRTFEDLCSLIDPAGMSQGTEQETNFPEDIGRHYRADLGSLLPPEQPRPTLGTGELAMLFLVDTALERSWDLRPQLSGFLHALFTHFDHRLPFVEQLSRRMLFSQLRAWVPGYDELPERHKYPSCAVLKATIDQLEADPSLIFWTENDTSQSSRGKLTRLCIETLSLLEPLHSQLRQEWGEAALVWGTSCASRPIAVRSLQLFRVLIPKVNRNTLAGLLGRLSNTIADPDESIQSFTNELLLTLTALARSQELDAAILPQYFWSAYACLSTSVEQEYSQALEIMDALLDKLDLNDAAVVSDLLERKPGNWAGQAHGLQRLVIVGLKSSVTSAASFKILCRLAEYDNNKLLEPGDGRLRDLFTVSLPWCLDAMDTGTSSPGSPPPHMIALGEKIARLAETAGLPNLARIMISFAKSRFRTKDDFLRQSAACLREYFAPKHWQEVATHLLSLVLNSQRWLRLKSMQVLQGLFSHRESRQPLELFGSELLMPLLRLLQTDLASQALEVLDEQVTIGGGGPKPSQVLRMSMRISAQVNTLAQEPGTAIFGIVSESGWCIPDPRAAMEQTRNNIMLTYDMCRMPRPSLLIFEPEEFSPPQQYEYEMPEDDFGDLLGKLAGLNSYFKEQGAEPSEEALQRAQAILSKSSSNSGHPETIPETPLANQLFDVAPPSPHDDFMFGDSDEEESDDGGVDGIGSDIEDSFAFDRKSRFFGKIR